MTISNDASKLCFDESFFSLDA